MRILVLVLTMKKETLFIFSKSEIKVIVLRSF